MNLLGIGLTAVLLLLSVHVIRVKATETCPHDKSGLRRWSDKDGWTKLGLSKPEAGDVVEITDDVLLDESPPELKSIEIQAGGSLVFSPDDDYTLVTGYMMIHGALYIGSERCKFPAKAKITLTGKRNEQNVEGFGGKFIGVAEGATLELHGQNKLAWTKLSTTLPKLTLDNGLIYNYQSVRLGICVPMDADLQLYTYSPVWAPKNRFWTQVFSVEEIDADDVGGKYFHDTENGILFVKFINYGMRGENSPNECGDDTLCPMLRVELRSGDRTDSDCRNRTSAYARKPISANLALPTVDLLPATFPTAPPGLGAGEFFPLTTRSVVDGAYGDWSEWGPCTTTCGGGTQIRSRACDSPIPQNGGKPCVGPSEETQGCSTNPCEIHGNFTTWSSWSPCNAIEGNGNINGYQIRSRACDNPAPQYNGDVCVGDTKEINKCLIAASA